MPRRSRRTPLPLVLAAALACSDRGTPTAPPVEPPPTGQLPPSPPPPAPSPGVPPTPPGPTPPGPTPPAPTPPAPAPPAPAPPTPTPTPTPPPAPTPGAYVARGTARAADGRPLAGVQIVVDNTVVFNSAVTGTTGADGSYRLTVPDGSWRVYAKYDVQYHGRWYRFDLHPSSDDSFPGADGAVRDFVWRLRGPASPSSGGAYHGGEVLILQDPNSDYLRKENVEITLTPVGPLVDGSAGEAITVRSGPPRSDTFGKAVGIPIGRYRVAARYAEPNKPVRPLAVRIEAWDAGPYAESVVADFEPNLMSCRDCMRLEVNWP